MYPDGRTPAGVYDLTGNVWEWCLSLYLGYPYDPSDGRNALDTDGARVVRGGSWGDGRRLARFAFRSRNAPGLFNTGLGFRLVLSLADSVF
jgi:formylglycine-generating enzyme required for sulfatase activity